MKRIIFITMLTITLFISLVSCSNDDDDDDDDNATDDDIADDDTYIGDDDDAFVGDWYIDTVDSMSGVIDEFMHTSIDLDSIEAPHISFFDMKFPHGLRVAAWQNNEWIVQRILNDSEFRGFASYELDDNDIGHITIQQIITNLGKDTYRILSHAKNENGPWELEVISDNVGENSLEVGNYASLAIDIDNKMHVSCRGLIYYNNVEGAWAYQGGDTCSSEGGSGYFTSIFIDDENEVHITHGGCDDIEDCQRYVTSLGGWHGECIPDSQKTAYQSSINVDHNGFINIAYNLLFEDTKFDHYMSLNFAYKAGDNWTTEEVDPNISDNCRELSDSYLGLDSDGNAHIAYTGLDDADNPVLKYATNASGEWVTEIVDPSPNSGIGASIAVDNEGYVHISYYDNGNSSLKYATNRP